jgi:hypothetical protein
MYDAVKTGAIYEQAVQRMRTYRSLAARMGNAHRSTQGKQDKKLERLGELIGETLAQLTDDERMALDCWRAGIMPDTYEVDHAALTDKPYVSIRKVERITEEYTEDERKAQLKQPKLEQAQDHTAGKARLRSFINQLNERL